VSRELRNPLAPAPNWERRRRVLIDHGQALAAPRWSEAMRKPGSDKQRDEYLRKAQACLEQAAHEPARRRHWLQQAEEWTRRASESLYGDADCATHEIHVGRLIAKPSK